MVNLRSSEDHYQRVQRISALTTAAAERALRRLKMNDLDGSWPEVGALMYVILSRGQLAAAESARLYVPQALAEQGIPDDPEFDVRPRAFSGVASDGRPLESLLYAPVAAAKRSLSLGAPRPLDAPTVTLRRIATTQTADAARMATSVGAYARTSVTYYTRMLNPPSCSRCAILAGRVYKNNEGFLRHPHCDCVHVPTREDMAGDLTTDPDAYFKSLSKAEQDRIFTKSGAQAVRDGADLGQVVNARRGMRTVAGEQRRAFGARITNEGITRRGFAVNAPGSTVARRRGVRLAPEAIYEVASDRADAVRLLRANGYIR